jgi:glutamate carboxypeptidase
VVEGEDRRPSCRHVFDPFDLETEAESQDRTDQRQADVPPAVQLRASSCLHEPDATAALRILARAVDLRGLQDIAARRYEEFVDVLRAIVDVDSGSYTPQGVNVVADVCQARFERAGWRVERIGHRPEAGEPQLGDLLIGRLGGKGGPRVLRIGHTDTVFDVGTVAERPFRIDGNRALGPGVSDMKGGLLLGLFGIDVLQEAGFDGFESVTYVCNPDEEIGSPWSSDVMRSEASRADVALVLEAARESGDIVSSRKGVSDYRIEVLGRAAHAGVEPEKGRSAVLEAAHKIVALHELNGRWPGVTVNAGLIRGGTRPNVIAERCEIQVDVRSPREETLAAAETEVERIANTHHVPGITVRVTDGKWHRPMEKGEASARLAALAIGVARELGFELRDAATGGASDANTTSAAGVPTIDGLGPVGGGDHSAGEWVDLASVVPRMSLLAGLISKLGTRTD